MTINELKQLILNKEIMAKLTKNDTILCNFIGEYQIQTYPIEKNTQKEISLEDYLAFLNGDKIVSEDLQNLINAK